MLQTVYAHELPEESYDPLIRIKLRLIKEFYRANIWPNQPSSCRLSESSSVGDLIINSWSSTEETSSTKMKKVTCSKSNGKIKKPLKKVKI